MTSQMSSEITLMVGGLTFSLTFVQVLLHQRKAKYILFSNRNVKGRGKPTILGDSSDGNKSLFARIRVPYISNFS